MPKFMFKAKKCVHQSIILPKQCCPKLCKQTEHFSRQNIIFVIIDKPENSKISSTLKIKNTNQMFFIVLKVHVAKHIIFLMKLNKTSLCRMGERVNTKHNSKSAQQSLFIAWEKPSLNKQIKSQFPNNYCLIMQTNSLGFFLFIKLSILKRFSPFKVLSQNTKKCFIATAKILFNEKP